MTLVGKKLQDIYDSGSKALIELEAKAAENFERTGKDHVESTQQSAEKFSLSLEDKSTQLQSELRDLMKASLSRLESTLSTERERNQAFVVSLISELQTRTEQMKSRLVALGQSHNENVDFAFNLARQNYLSGLETAKINLDESGSEHKGGITAYGSTIVDKSMQTTDEGFWKQHEDSADTIDSFFSAAREQEGVVSDRAALLAQTLSVGCQAKLSNAKTLSARATDEVKASVRSLLESINKHASSIEKDSNEKYAHLSDSHFQEVDAKLSNFADELSNLHDGITDRLLKNTEELSTDLLSASSEAQETLRIKCEDAVGTVNLDFTSFKQKLETRLQQSRGQKQTLDDDKNQILIAIKNELISIQDTFAKKIVSLLATTKSELAGMTKSVEGKIIAAMETCDKQIGSSASSTQKLIEDEAAAFLEELTNCHKAAVDEISASAHGKSPMINVPKETETEKKDEAEPKNKSITDSDYQLNIESIDTKPISTDTSDNKTTRRSRRRKSDEGATAERDNIEDK